MKKRIVVKSVILAVLIALVSCSVIVDIGNKLIIKKGTLIINNEVVSNDYTTIKCDSVRIPFVLLLEKIGIEVEWENDEYANVFINGNRYRLSLPDLSMHFVEGAYDRFGKGYNQIDRNPGCTFYYAKAVDHDIILDENTITFALFLFQYKVQIRTDRENDIVYVDRVYDD